MRKRETPYELVKECHRAFEQEIDEIDLSEDSPRVTAFIELRKKLLREETEELCEALDSRILENIAKEECDLTYVSRGLLVGVKGLLDPDRSGGFYEVHDSNMSKLDDNGKPIKREDGKFLKSKNYRPANMAKYVGEVTEPEAVE